MDKTTVVLRDRVTGRNLGHDLTGHRYGHLEIISATERRDNGYRIWAARCDCGNTIERPTYRFIRGLECCGTKCPYAVTGRPRIENNGAHINALFGHYRQSAAARRLQFELTKETARALFEGDCHYCGKEPTERRTHQNLSGTFCWNGIDRMDSATGYIPSNCVSCCPTCNFAKGSMGVDDFLAWIKRVHKHLEL